MTFSEEDIVLRFLHTADWHLGKRFPAFKDEAKLTRARRDVLERIFSEAERSQVHAVLCAGDLFDTPEPGPEWWRPLAESFQRRAWKDRIVVLLPGNHDPLIPGSVWSPEHPFRRALPDWVKVVEEDLLELPLPENAVLYAVPCKSKAGQRDPTLAIPKRAEGDDRIRIGLVHGTTYDLPNQETNFPISMDAAVERGLDYLAIGDTHGFRYVPPERKYPPTIYPGAPEPTSFTEKDAGCVAVVQVNRQRKPTVHKEPVAAWSWEERTVRTLNDLRVLRGRELKDRVLRLKVEMALPAPELEEAEAILSELEGTLANHGRVGVLDLDRSHLTLDTSDLEAQSRGLPEVLAQALRKLNAAREYAQQSADTRAVAAADLAMRHLIREAKRTA